MKHTLSLIATGAILAFSNAHAVTTFTEDFDTDNRNWADSFSQPLTFVATDGAPGASPGHVSTSFAFSSADPNFGATLFRGQSNLGSSDGAFVGDYLGRSVVTLSSFVRHNAPTAVTFSTRFASPFNFPGALAVNFAPVLPNVWTELLVAIDPDNPAFISFEGSDFETVFSNIGNIQFTSSVPDGFVNDDTLYSFELDNVTVTIPEPSTGVLALLGGLFVLRHRRR